jgi:hypothetical protein
LYAEREREREREEGAYQKWWLRDFLGDVNPRLWGFSELGEKEFEILNGKK